MYADQNPDLDPNSENSLKAGFSPMKFYTDNDMGNGSYFFNNGDANHTGSVAMTFYDDLPKDCSKIKLQNEALGGNGSKGAYHGTVGPDTKVSKGGSGGTTGVGSVKDGENNIKEEVHCQGKDGHKDTNTDGFTGEYVAAAGVVPALTYDNSLVPSRESCALGITESVEYEDDIVAV